MSKGSGGRFWITSSTGMTHGTLKPSPQKGLPEWRTGRSWDEGERCVWNGARLLCGRSHFAGDSAIDPWDPGSGWDAAKAATLWSPVSHIDARRLLKLEWLPRAGRVACSAPDNLIAFPLERRLEAGAPGPPEG